MLAADPESLPRSAGIAIDPIVLAFTMLISVITGVLFGMAPLLNLRQQAVTMTLKESGQRSTAGGARAQRPGHGGSRARGRSRHRSRLAPSQLLEPDERRRRLQSLEADHIRRGA